MKRAKKTEVEYTYIWGYLISYRCPHCKTRFTLRVISKDVTRFKCPQCEEEIIVVEKGATNVLQPTT